MIVNGFGQYLPLSVHDHVIAQAGPGVADNKRRASGARGANFEFRRFHEALLALGAPPLGTMADALDN
jgi:hypothetical protein